jgi:hypothetical protein
MRFLPYGRNDKKARNVIPTERSDEGTETIAARYIPQGMK